MKKHKQRFSRKYRETIWSLAINEPAVDTAQAYDVCHVAESRGVSLAAELFNKSIDYMAVEVVGIRVDNNIHFGNNTRH